LDRRSILPRLQTIAERSGTEEMMQRHLILGIFSYLAVTSLVLAQTATGVIRGNVQDLTGAVIVDVHVSLVDEARNQIREQITNEKGFFEFRALSFGNYRVEVEHPRFKKQVIKNVALQVAQTESLTVTLEVGSVTESIVVQADRGLLEASDASLSQVIDDKRLLGFPINGRNVMQLVSLSAGVINGGRASATQRQANYGPGFSVAGQRDNTSVVLIDGMEISGQELNNYPLAIPPLESVAEFRVQTSNYSAEFGGNSGAVINVASKRGSHEFHATLFEFLRNDALDARNYFSTTVDPLKRNQFGFAASGPVFLPKVYNGQNKLFWMFAYEGTRRRQAVTSTTLVPTLKERAGDFSGLSATIVDPITKIPFPGNVIPANRINPVGAALANLYPVPNNTDPSRNYIGHPKGVSNNDVLAARIDYQPGARDTIWGRFTRNAPFDSGVGQALSPAFPGFDQEQSDNNLQFAIGDVHSFRPTIVNEANIGLVRFRRERHSLDAFKRNWIRELGIKGLSPIPFTWAAPSMTPAGYSEIGYSSNNAVFRWVTNAGQIVDNLSFIHRAHTVKAGLTIQLKRVTTIQWGQPDGTYTFSGQFSAPVPVSTTSRFHALADLLLGYPSSYSVQITPFSPHLSYTDMGYYIQDDWKITHNVTANVGLRWEYFGRPVERDNRIASFDLATGQQVFPGQNGYPRSLVDPYYKNFAPRIGVAWRATDRIAVRSGYGIFYTPDVINSYRQLGFQNPFGNVSNLVVRPADPQNPLPVFTVEDPLAQATRLATNNRNGMQRNLRDGQVQQWNLTAQYLLTKDTLFEAAYHGSKSSHLMSALNYNETNPFPPQPPGFALIFPYPQLGSVFMYESRAGANYHALQARLEHRFVNGFTCLVSYTFQKTLTDLDSSSVGVAFGAGAGLQTIKNIRANYGPTVFDRPQRLIASWLYELPLLKQRRDWLAKIAQGWQIGAIATFQDGPSLTPSSFGVPFVGSHANVLGNPNLPRGDRTINRWFDVSKLANPAPGQLGNAGKGVIRGSGNNKWDLIISKSFSFAERHRVEFRAELFNAFNHPQFDDPVVTPGNNPLAGKISSASDFGFTQTERVIQLGLKYSF
jgi:Carboxypeptidase regulatory-like domain/TonB dependent receptor